MSDAAALLKIRQATAADATGIHALHTESVKKLCAGHYTAEQITNWVKDRGFEGYLPGIERGEMFVAEAEAQVVGFGHAVIGEVLAVFVAPDRVNQGIGTALLSYGMEMAQRNSQRVVRLEATLNAQRFYERAGFVAIEHNCVQRGDASLPVVVMQYWLQV